MNVWVELARGLSVQDQAVRDLVARLVSAVDNGGLVVPLSAAHYLELWHRRDKSSRETVGAVMRLVTGYHTLAPVQAVRQYEVDAYVDRHLGANARLRLQDILGRGANHAFDSPYGRFRWVSSLESGGTPEGPSIAAPKAFKGMRLEGPRWEWIQLVGLQEFIESPGVDRTPEHRHGSRYVAQELELRRKLRDDPAGRALLLGILIAQEIEGIRDEINRSCWERRTDPHGLFLENPRYADPPAAMRAFVAGLPSVDTLVTLRAWKHRDLNHPWEQHDKSDLMALTVAIPYCDVVVTERRWAHIVTMSGLARAYGTKTGHGLSAVQEALDSVSGR
jgi:hypothetical protein